MSDTVIEAVGEPGPGGAHNEYDLTTIEGNVWVTLRFRTIDRSGFTNEDLLKVVMDRLRGFQSGPFACAENHDALKCLQDAMSHLVARAVNRRSRGVEGTLTP